jgi:hypothetical protein
MLIIMGRHVSTAEFEDVAKAFPGTHSPIPSIPTITPSPFHSAPNPTQVPRAAQSATASASCAPSRRRSTKSSAGTSPAASPVPQAPRRLLPARRRPRPSARLTTRVRERDSRLRRRARRSARLVLLARRRRRRRRTVVLRMRKRGCRRWVVAVVG